MNDDRMHFVTVSNCKFYTDGTYIQRTGEQSFWKIEEGIVYIRYRENDKWISLNEKGPNSTDYRHMKEILTALDIFIDKELLD